MPPAPSPLARRAPFAVAAAALVLALAAPSRARADEPPTPAGIPAMPPPAPAPAAAPAVEAGTHPSLEALEEAFAATEKAEIRRVRIARMLAIEAYARSHPTAPDLEDARANLVRLAGNTESWELGVAYADAYLAAYPAGRAVVDARFTKADALSHLDRPAETRAAFEQLTRTVSPAADLNTAFAAWSFYATWLKTQGDVEGAKTVYRGMKAAFQGTKNGPAVGNTADAEIAALDQIGKPARAFPPDARDLDGRPVTLEEFRGKVLLVDFWATWCAPCRADMPDVVAAERKYRALGFEVLGVTLDAPTDAAQVRAFTTAHGMPWRQVHYGPPPPGVRGDGRNGLAEAYGVRAVPHTVLVGRDGRVIAVGVRGRDLDRALARAFGVPAK